VDNYAVEKTGYRQDITPPVTLVISAFNEEQIIGKKLLNALKLVTDRSAGNSSRVGWIK
jgi:hypothetical protein